MGITELWIMNSKHFILLYAKSIISWNFPWVVLPCSALIVDNKKNGVETWLIARSLTLCVEWVFTFNKDVVASLCKTDITFWFKKELGMLNSQLLFLTTLRQRWQITLQTADNISTHIHNSREATQQVTKGLSWHYPSNVSKKVFLTLSPPESQACKV